MAHQNRQRSSSGPGKNRTAASGADAESLRGRAEAIAGQSDREGPESADIASLHHALHELQVHQIELEMQNEELRRTQLELDAVRTRYFDLYELAPVGYLTIVGTGLIQQANLFAATLLGIPRQRLLKQPFAHFIAPRHRDDYYLMRKRTGEAPHAPSTIELQLLREGGAPFWAQLTATLTAGEEGEDLLRVAITDISDLKGMERDLLASRERWRSMAENSFDVVAEVDRDYRYLYINRAPPGFHAETLIGKRTPLDFISSDQHDVVKAAFVRAFSEGHPQCYDVRIGEKWFSNVIGPVFLEGQVASLSILSRDITAEKKAQLTLRQSEQRLQLALAGGDVGEFNIELQAAKVFLSPRFCALLGYAEDDPRLVRTLDGLKAHLMPEESEQTLEILRSAVRDDGEIDRELRLCCANGEYRWFHCRGRVFEEANCAHLSGFVTDTTARKLEETQRRLLEDRLRKTQRLETLGTLASGIAHDFNNLLVPVMGNAEMLLTELPPNDHLLERVQDIRQAAKRARELIARMLAFGRPGEERSSRIHVESAVQEAVHLLSPSIPGNIRLITRLNASNAGIDCDHGQLVQAIVNLVTNARQAIGEAQGKIEIDVERLTLDAGFAEQHNVSADSVRIAVRDDGCGMTPATVERAFDPFFTTKPSGQGSGLGLASVHAVVRRCCGAIRVESSPGKGALLEMYFPAKNVEAPDESPATPSLEIPINKACKSILLVDDMPMVLKILSQVLTSGGYKVETAESAAHAMARIRDAPNEFHLVVTDHSMPQMTGIELAEQLNIAAPGIPVILISGLGDSALSGPGPSNLAAVLGKPADMSKLLGTVDRVIRKT